MLEVLIWNPYQKEATQKGEVKHFADTGALTIEYPDLQPILDVWASPNFYDFLHRSFGESNAQSLSEMRYALGRVNGLANQESHEHAKTSDEFEAEVDEQYRKFLGIDRQGILPFLLKLRRE